MRSQIEVNPAFHRAFKTLSRDEKIDYYYKIIQVLKVCLEGGYDPSDQDVEPNRQITLYFFHEEEGHWETRRVDVNPSKKIVRFQHGGGDDLNLHYYIVRNSKKKDRKSLALEST
jgi:hypothetical protein